MKIQHMDIYAIPLQKHARIFRLGKSFETLFATEMKSQAWPGIGWFITTKQDRFSLLLQ